jgi:hypothetical protein
VRRPFIRLPGDFYKHQIFWLWIEFCDFVRLHPLKAAWTGGERKSSRSALVNQKDGIREKEMNQGRISWGVRRVHGPVSFNKAATLCLVEGQPPADHQASWRLVSRRM